MSPSQSINPITMSHKENELQNFQTIQKNDWKPSQLSRASEVMDLSGEAATTNLLSQHNPYKSHINIYSYTHR